MQKASADSTDWSWGDVSMFVASAALALGAFGCNRVQPGGSPDTASEQDVTETTSRDGTTTVDGSGTDTDIRIDGDADGGGRDGEAGDTGADAVRDAKDTEQDSEQDSGALPSESVILDVDFDEVDLGRYSEEDYASQWPEAEWLHGLQEGRGEIVENPDGTDERVLEVLYPGGKFGSNDQGLQWKVPFDRSHEELYLRYRIRFEQGFDFVKGGKLPGLIGGEANTGGDVPDGTDGWSARMMWRRDGKAVQYVYHPDQPGKYGEDFEYRRDDRAVTFEPGTWHTVQHRIVMNSPGQSDGRIEAWFDGELVLEVTDLRFRDITDFAIDGFYFSTFFGGGDASWAPDSDMRVYFDDVTIADRRIP